jgi:hypothetical protein
VDRKEWQASCKRYISDFGENFEKEASEIDFGLPVERADLEWRKTKDVSQQWFSETQ